MTTGTEPTAETSEPGIARGRLEAFSDGVMAVAITLLVLGVEAPEIAPGETLWEALDAETLGSLALFALSFAVIARFWMVHHDAFKTLPQRVPAGLAAVNFGFLFLICLVPFSTTLYGDNDHDIVALVVYAGTFALIAALLGLLAAPGRHGLTVRFIAVPLIFLAAIPVGLIVGVAYGPWVWLALVGLSTDRFRTPLSRPLR